jgi:hypothetical protein
MSTPSRSAPPRPYNLTVLLSYCSLNWISLAMVAQHLNVSEATIAKFPRNKPGECRMIGSGGGFFAKATCHLSDFGCALFAAARESPVGPSRHLAALRTLVATGA